jgi:dipeptidyl aminopeptidase/acylaminoacyl peptidase
MNWQTSVLLVGSTLPTPFTTQNAGGAELAARESTTVSASSQAKRPFTFEDMMKLKRVGQPEVSPDGRWVIFTVVDVDLDANTKTPHIWIVPSVGGQERALITTQDADRPRWAPDGRRFAYISTSDGSPQVWIANFDGATGTATEMRKLTSIPTAAAGELWSPDGQNIAFLSTVYPECLDEECNARKDRERANSKVKATLYTKLPLRHVSAYNEGKRSHIFLASVDACVRPGAAGCPAGASRDLTPGDYDASVFPSGQDEYAFSPDGREICYSSNHDSAEFASTNNDLWIVPVAGGLAKNITGDNPASDSTPLYSPDGRYIAYRAQRRPGYESDRFRLMLYDRSTKAKRNLTERFDRWVGTFTWAPGSRELYFVAENSGGSWIYWLSFGLRGDANSVLVAPRIRGYNDHVTVTGDGDQLVFTRMSLSAPNEVHVANTRSPDGECAPAAIRGSSECAALEAVALTHINDSLLSQFSFSPLEPFWFTGAHGDRVEGFLVKPPNFDSKKKYPVKFVLKGGPQIAAGDLWSYSGNSELLAASGYVIITINFHGSTGYGQRFIDAVNGDWGGAPFEDLMKGLTYAERTYDFIDRDRECALGSSFGGYMANWVLGHTDRFKCIVSNHSVFNAESFWGSTDELWFPNWEFRGTPYSNRATYKRWSPDQYAKNFKTPTLVIHGQRDYRCDVSQAIQLFTTLQMLDVPSKMLYFPDEAQYPQKPQNAQLWYRTVNDWIDQWTK